MTKIYLSILFSLAFLNVGLAGGCVKWPSTSFQPIPNAKGQIAPDMGIYWYNTNVSNTTPQESLVAACRTDDPANKAACLANLQKAGYFDPSKPTIIFIHGWQPSATANKQRFDLCYQYPISQSSMSPVYNTLQHWQGWNVGVFYWTQFADESNVLDAEAKIYSTQGEQGMRWSYLDAKDQLQYCDSASLHCAMPLTASGQVATVLEMLETAYEQALPNALAYHGSELRIAGQSLGTQLAVQLTHYIMTDSSLPQPTRLSLMDPYFSPNEIESRNEHFPASIAGYNTIMLDLIESQAHHQFPVDVYRTSRLSYSPSGNPGTAFMNEVAYMSLSPQYFYQGEPYLKKEGLLHISSIYLYFESKKEAPLDRPGNSDYAYTNAAASNAEVLALMNHKRYQQYSIAETHFSATWDDLFYDESPVKDQSFSLKPSLAAVLALPSD